MVKNLTTGTIAVPKLYLGGTYQEVAPRVKTEGYGIANSDIVMRLRISGQHRDLNIATSLTHTVRDGCYFFTPNDRRVSDINKQSQTLGQLLKITEEEFIEIMRRDAIASFSVDYLKKFGFRRNLQECDVYGHPFWNVASMGDRQLLKDYVSVLKEENNGWPKDGAMAVLLIDEIDIGVGAYTLDFSYKNNPLLVPIALSKLQKSKALDGFSSAFSSLVERKANLIGVASEDLVTKLKKSTK